VEDYRSDLCTCLLNAFRCKRVFLEMKHKTNLAYLQYNSVTIIQGNKAKKCDQSGMEYGVVTFHFASSAFYLATLEKQRHWGDAKKS
jgi:hypothetical protein